MKRLHVFVLFALFTMIALTPPASAQDDSTILPVDAVNATEILNEAGVAQALEASGIALTVGVKQKIAEHTISVPTPGYVLAMSTGTIGLVHMEGSDDIIYVGVSTDCDATPTLPSDQLKSFGLSEFATSGSRNWVFSAQKLFVVNAGDTKVCIVADVQTGTAPPVAFAFTLSLVFIPTKYGPVEQ